ELLGRGQVAAEVLLQTRQDRPCRGDRQLLADDLEDQHAEHVERRQLVEPGAGSEVGSCVDDLLQHRVGLPKMVPRLRVDPCHIKAFWGLETSAEPGLTMSISISASSSGRWMKMLSGEWLEPCQASSMRSPPISAVDVHPAALSEARGRCREPTDHPERRKPRLPPLGVPTGA